VRATSRPTALDAIDLQIEGGEYVAITGPSGCGKFNIAWACSDSSDSPTSGSYRLEGEEGSRQDAARELGGHSEGAASVSYSRASTSLMN